ncbi:sulfite exporter TauE/SafE family protein [Rosistilla oblonga]|uniref:sulfite exporter TauE/SafE family protein n=1 Tax=Rosistilla oblonga TaxID=2527990 RepID=UPI003A983FC4
MMEMLPLEELAVFAAVFCLGIFVQSATGFAGGLVIMPLMLWAGQGIPETQAALLVATTPQNAWGLWQYRQTVQLKEFAFPATLRMASLPVGIAVLSLIDGFPVQFMRQLIGAVVILCVMMLLIFRPTPREHLHVGWTWLAFLSSGFFQGCTGTGGPMMVLWVQAHDWSTKRTRAFLFTMYLVSMLPAWGLLYYWFGQRIINPSLTAMAIIPLLLVATWMGLHVGTWLGRHRLRRVTMCVLLVVGLVGLLSPLFSPARSAETSATTNANAN